MLATMPALRERGAPAESGSAMPVKNRNQIFVVVASLVTFFFYARTGFTRQGRS